MMQVQIAPISSIDQYLREAAARRRRLMGKPARQQNSTRLPEAQPGGRYYDAHVTAWREWKEARPVGNLRRYIVGRCIELGANYAQIVGPSRRRSISDERQLLAWEIKTVVKPEISFVELGRIFGGRDHTTMMHAVSKIEAIKQREKANAG